MGAGRPGARLGGEERARAGSAMVDPRLARLLACAPSPPRGDEGRLS